MGRDVTTFRVKFVPDREFFITAWSGSFALRIVYDLLHRSGLDYGKRERKPFVVEPIADSRGRYVITGLYVRGRGEARPHPRFSTRRVAAGEPITVTVHFLDDHPARAFLAALTEDPVLREPACDLHLHQVSLRVWRPPNPYPPSPCVEVYELEFLSPTAFMFHGIDVLYPSPARILYSALKTYSQVAGVDTTGAAGSASKLAELAGFSVRRFLVDIGEGRKVPAFMGRARLAVYGSRDGGLVRAALETAASLGLGISRAVGFGRVRVARPSEAGGQNAGNGQSTRQA